MAVVSGRSLKDELASLKIERKRSSGSPRVSERLRDEAPLASLSAEDALPVATEPLTRRSTQLRRPRNWGLGFLSLLLWLIPLGLVGGGAYFAYNQYVNAKPKVTVKVAKVQAMTLGQANNILTAKGYIRSFHQAKLGAKVPGRIAEVLVKENQFVKYGEVLAELEHTDMDKQKESRQRMLDRNKAELREAEVDLHFKELKARRSLRLRTQGQMSEEEAEQAQSAYEVARKRIDTLRATIDYQQAVIDELTETISEMQIKAPFDGTVLEKAAEKGETIVLGGLGAASGRGSVVTLADMNDLEVETDIAEKLLGQLRDPKQYPKQQRAEIEVSAFPDRRFHGFLDRIVPLGDRARGTVKVYVKIDEKGTPLFPELVANVSFLPARQSESESSAPIALYVPKSAVIESDGSSFVWVVSTDQVITRRPVQVDITADWARVDEGLQRGENVVVSPPPGLVEGQIVVTET
jgi:RND family efflux transporter MFP subunit